MLLTYQQFSYFINTLFMYNILFYNKNNVETPAGLLIQCNHEHIVIKIVCSNIGAPECNSDLL